MLYCVIMFYILCGGEELFYYLYNIFIMLFIVSCFGYFFVILKEKIYLKRNIILIDKKSIKQEHIDQADMKEFMMDGNKMKSGDEVKLITKEKRRYNGVLIGAKRTEGSIMIVTHNDEVKTFSIDNIFRLKVTSKYGKFFK